MPYIQKYQIPHIDIGLFLFMILNNEVNKFALIMFNDPFLRKPFYVIFHEIRNKNESWFKARKTMENWYFVRKYLTSTVSN